MNRNRFSAGFAAGIATVLLAATGAASAQDKIKWKDRADTEGVVISLNVKDIKYRLTNSPAEQEEPSKNVRDIEFDQDNTLFPYEYNHGVAAFHKGDYKGAVEQFERAIDRIKRTNSPNHPMRDFCRKYIVESYLKAGDAAGVMAAARELRKEKPDSFFVRDSFLMQYEAWKRRRDAKLQEETIKELEEAIKTDRRLDGLQPDAELLRADFLEISKKFADALAIYSKFGANREVWKEVTLGTLRCLSALGRMADLKNRVESLLSEIKDRKDANPEVYLGALVARGDVQLSEGKIKEALLDYMKGALDPALARQSAEHEAALAKAAIAAARFAKQFGEKDKANKTLYVGRAMELRDDLKKAYPQTGWSADVDGAIREANLSQ
jgi:tetratricopeptide (TPR) repeat protein